MHLNAKPPVFVPERFCSEIEKFSKAALMDIVWDLATRCAASEEFDVCGIMEEVRHTGRIVMDHRKTAESPLKKLKRNQSHAV